MYTSVRPHDSINDLVVEVVHGHARIDDDRLGIDAAGTWAEQKRRNVGCFFGLYGPPFLMP